MPPKPRRGLAPPPVQRAATSAPSTQQPMVASPVTTYPVDPPPGKVKTTYTYTSETPTVTCLVVSRGNRTKFLDITKRIMLAQDYPNIIEWLFVNGSQTQEEATAFQEYVASNIAMYLPNVRLAQWPGGGKHIGYYRNFANTLTKGELIVCFDDDDYYPPDRVSRTVKAMVEGKHAITGCECNLVYDFDLNLTAYYAGKDGSYTANNTIAYCAQFAKTHKYREEFFHAEEAGFIGDEYVYQLPKDLFVAISHHKNTYPKMRSIMEGVLHREGILERPGAYLVSKPISEIIPDEEFLSEMREILAPKYADESSYDITYYAGVFQKEWDPARKDLGGSEQAIVHLAEEWVKKGLKVAVYARIEGFKQLTQNGVEYFPVHTYPYKQKQKTLILWRSSGCFLYLTQHEPRAEKIIVDFHDNYDPSIRIIKRHYDKIDHFMLKSKYHVRLFEEANLGIPKKKITILPNGVRVKEFTPGESEPERDPLRFVYASAYCRGLVGIACILWPRIQALEPRAELHCYYGTESFIDPKQREAFNEALVRFNIMDHGRQPIDIIRREKMRAGFHLYPTFTTEEIDCISIRESLVTGCIPVITNHGVFAERDGFHISFTPGDDESLNGPAQAILDLAKNTKRMDRLRKELAKSKTIMDWETIASKWPCAPPAPAPATAEEVPAEASPTKTNDGFVVLEK